MGSYYNHQAPVLPVFLGHYRQRGSGFAASASGIGKIALTHPRKFIIPAGKRVGKELRFRAYQS